MERKVFLYCLVIKRLQNPSTLYNFTYKSNVCIDISVIVWKINKTAFKSTSFPRNQHGRVLTHFTAKIENTCKFDCSILTWRLLAISLRPKNLYKQTPNWEGVAFAKAGLVLFIGAQIGFCWMKCLTIGYVFCKMQVSPKVWHIFGHAIKCMLRVSAKWIEMAAP